MTFTKQAEGGDKVSWFKKHMFERNANVNKEQWAHWPSKTVPN